MLSTIVVLIPKGTSGKEFRGIGLLEVIWKLLERALDLRLSEIELHDFLHAFRAKRDCGTGIIEATLHQQLAAREQVPLYIRHLFGSPQGVRRHGQGAVPSDY